MCAGCTPPFSHIQYSWIGHERFRHASKVEQWIPHWLGTSTEVGQTMKSAGEKTVFTSWKEEIVAKQRDEEWNKIGTMMKGRNTDHTREWNRKFQQATDSSMPRKAHIFFLVTICKGYIGRIHWKDSKISLCSIHERNPSDLFHRKCRYLAQHDHRHK